MGNNYDRKIDEIERPSLLFNLVIFILLITSAVGAWSIGWFIAERIIETVRSIL